MVNQIVPCVLEDTYNLLERLIRHFVLFDTILDMLLWEVVDHPVITMIVDGDSAPL